MTKLTSVQQEQRKAAALAALQEIVHSGNIWDNMQSTPEEELQEPTAALQAPSLMVESRTQFHSDTGIKAIMHCQQRTKEQIDLEGIQMIPFDQALDTCTSTTILTKDLL